MIIEYHRPATLEEALALLARPALRTLPMGGGTLLNAPSEEQFAVVDIQDLGLRDIEVRSQFLEIGAAATLEDLLGMEAASPAFKKAVRHEATRNLRQVGTAAGTLVAADGRSPFASVMLAADTRVAVTPGSDQLEIGDLLNARQTLLPGKLITSLSMPRNLDLAYEYVARSPADRPVVSVAGASWPSGRLRFVVGGFGVAPRLALDAVGDLDGVIPAVRSICQEAGDEWASAAYRQDAAAALAERILAEWSLA
jgi:CO/xanthine dehydrogenase FAD-binding subunit